MEAEHPPQADGHVGIARKIEIDLQCKCNRQRPAGKRAGGRDIRLKFCQLVGQQHLFAQPHAKARDAGGHVLQRLAAVVQLLLDGLVAHDGARDELREERDIRHKIRGIFLQLRRTARNVDEIRQNLERVEADAHRQRQVGQRQRQPEERIDAGDQKIRVFIDEQRRKAHRDGKCLRPARLVFLQQKAKAPARQRAQNEQRQLLRLAPEIEQKACRQQHRVFCPARRKQVDRQHQRQKQIQKRDTGKQQAFVLRSENYAFSAAVSMAMKRSVSS